MPPINRNLGPGSTGSDVQALQEWLKSQNYFPSNQATTQYYGDITKKAVADWQRAVGIDAGSDYGWFGPKSINYIQSTQRSVPQETFNFSPTGGNTTPVYGGGSYTNQTTTDRTLPKVEKVIPPIPDSLYTSLRSQIESGAITPKDAQNIMQNSIKSGQYSGTVDTNKLFAPGLKIKGSDGAIYDFQNGGTGLMYKTTATIEKTGSSGFKKVGQTTEETTPTQPKTSSTTGTTPPTPPIPPTDKTTPVDPLVQRMDEFLKVMKDFIGTKTINPDINVNDPTIVSQFLQQATSELHPYYAQKMGEILPDLNRSLSYLKQQYDTTMQGAEATFQKNLAAQREQAAGAGTVFSGARGAEEQGMMSAQNRALELQRAESELKAGELARSAESQLGSSAMQNFTLPNFSKAVASVSNKGGFNVGGGSQYYTPGQYQVGSLPMEEKTEIEKYKNRLLENYRTADIQGRTFASLNNK